MHGRSSMYEGKDVITRGDVAAAPVSVSRRLPQSAQEARREIETLRSINAQLVRQVDLLKQREAHAQRLADRDGLTGLYNRRKMLELLEDSVQDAARRQGQVGLLFIDLDGFKQVNDAHGHAAGDKLLLTVAGRIAARTRTGDVACRYGGDEFVVILPRIADRSAAGQVAEAIRRRVALPYRLDGVEVEVSAAIGVAIYPDQARSGEALLRFADEAMYREKSHSRDPSPPPEGAGPPFRRRDDLLRKRLPL